jgi:hypothetical protein
MAIAEQPADTTIVTPTHWQEQFRSEPANCQGATKIICTHSVHGTEIFYLTLDQWQDNILPLLTPFWINNYTVLMTSMDV